MEKLKVYFAGPYDTRSELKDLIDEAPDFIESTSRWIVEDYTKLPRRHAAIHDLEDVDRADAIFVAVAQRGWGHALEFGYALAKNKPVVIIDEEGNDADWNVFLCLPQLIVCEDWESALTSLRHIHNDPPSWRPWQIGDYVQDGGEWGTIVRCEMCGGSGQLHKPDTLPPIASPEDPSLLHPNSQMFRAIIKEVWELHVRKSGDYGTREDPMQNLRSAVDFGVPNWIGAAIRANDKIQRIKAGATRALTQGEVLMTNESIIDSFRDAANYFVLIEILFREWLNDTGQDRVGDNIDVIYDQARSLLGKSLITEEEGQIDEEGLAETNQTLQSLTGAGTTQRDAGI